MNFFYGLENGFSGNTYIEPIFGFMVTIFTISYTSVMWLYISSDLGLLGDESWFNYSVPKLYKHKIQHHFKYNYHRVIAWAFYFLYNGVVVFYVPFYSLANITGGKNGLNSNLGQQSLASCIIFVFTNWVIVFIHYRLINRWVILWSYLAVMYFFIFLAMN